jgi:hypothetical protein
LILPAGAYNLSSLILQPAPADVGDSAVFDTPAGAGWKSGYSAMEIRAGMITVLSREYLGACVIECGYS